MKRATAGATILARGRLFAASADSGLSAASLCPSAEAA